MCMFFKPWPSLACDVTIRGALVEDLRSTVHRFMYSLLLIAMTSTPRKSQLVGLGILAVDFVTQCVESIVPSRQLFVFAYLTMALNKVCYVRPLPKCSSQLHDLANT